MLRFRAPEVVCCVAHALHTGRRMKVDSTLVLTSLVKRYSDTSAPAVDGIDLKIDSGSYCCLLGPSGCGKSSTLRMIAGHELASSGEILLGGKYITRAAPADRGTAMMFQSYALFPHLSVLDNVAFSWKMRGRSVADRHARAKELLELVSMTPYINRLPSQLSGGQQQRVALARALVMEPRVLLLDEPLGALDLKLRKHMQVELKRIQRDVGITFVYVTHDQGEAMSMSDRIAVMSEGRIEQLDAPEAIYDRPASTFVAGFIGEMNVIGGAVRHTTAGVATIDLAGGTVAAQIDPARPAPTGAVRVGIRPEKVRVTGGEHGTNALAATVITRLQLGSSIQLVASLSDGTEVTAVVPRTGADAEVDGLGAGDRVCLSWADTAPIVLAA
jgi:putative spermidine/putrescine transport system ATP-binding protein